MITMRYIFPLIILLVVVFFLWQGLAKDPNLLPSPLINHPIPEFSAQDLLKKSTILRKKIFLQELEIYSNREYQPLTATPM